MFLSARILDNVTSVNDWEIVTEARFTEGDTVSVYFQLVDLNKNKTSKPVGRRYMPQSGATLSVTIQNIDSAKTLNKVAVQPYSSDGSIWRISFAATDGIKGTYSMLLALNEGGVITRGLVSNVLSIQPQSGARV